MKKGKIFGLLLSLALIVSALGSCNEDDEPVESCSEEEFCDEKSVTTCCDKTACVYKYDGKEYPEEDVDLLAEELECSDGGMGGRIADKAQLIERLKATLAKAKAGL